MDNKCRINVSLPILTCLQSASVTGVSSGQGYRKFIVETNLEAENNDTERLDFHLKNFSAFSKCCFQNCSPIYIGSRPFLQDL